MSKQDFTAAQRNAVYLAHGEKCYICGRLLDLVTMEVDHVVPERPAELAEVKRALGLDGAFDIDSYANWMPACGKCNREKGGTPWSPSLLAQRALQRARAKADEARATEREVVSRRQLAAALNRVLRAGEAGTLSEDMRRQLAPLLQFQFARRAPERAGTPLRLTPLYEVLSDDGRLRVVRGRYGVGARPSRSDADPSFGCPRCGPNAAWNGARCVTCGEMDE